MGEMRRSDIRLSGIFAHSNDVPANKLAPHQAIGFTTFILDISPSEDELRHTAIVFERARGRTKALGGAGR
jgi:hypothetical protein